MLRMREDSGLRTEIFYTQQQPKQTSAHTSAAEQNKQTLCPAEICGSLPESLPGAAAVPGVLCRWQGAGGVCAAGMVHHHEDPDLPHPVQRG